MDDNVQFGALLKFACSESAKWPRNRQTLNQFGGSKEVLRIIPLPNVFMGAEEQ